MILVSAETLNPNQSNFALNRFDLPTTRHI